jgi:hypothetical protein
MEVVFIIIGFVFVALILRLIAGGIDHDRVEEYISERGGRVIDKQWNPFGKGWFGSEHERIYDIKYEDKEGNVHQATCKTSMLSGVYFTQDEIVEYAIKEKFPDKMTELEIENQRLKQQIEDLKRNKGF